MPQKISVWTGACTRKCIYMFTHTHTHTPVTKTHDNNKKGGSDKGFSSWFCADSWVRHETPEEGRRTYQPNRCDYNDKDEVNSPNILSNNDTK